MADKPSQSYANHVRFDPVFHFFLAPASLLTFIAAVWNTVKHPELISFVVTIGALLLFVEIGLNRTYSLKVQDRVIRLEEHLRLAPLLAEPQRARLDELTVKQLVALRFAPDDEAPALVAKALDGLPPADLKKSIRNWRPDYQRV